MLCKTDAIWGLHVYFSSCYVFFNLVILEMRCFVHFYINKVMIELRRFCYCCLLPVSLWMDLFIVYTVRQFCVQNYLTRSSITCLCPLNYTTIFGFISEVKRTGTQPPLQYLLFSSDISHTHTRARAYTHTQEHSQFVKKHIKYDMLRCVLKLSCHIFFVLYGRVNIEMFTPTAGFIAPNNLTTVCDSPCRNEFFCASTWWHHVPMFLVIMHLTAGMHCQQHLSIEQKVT